LWLKSGGFFFFSFLHQFLLLSAPLTIQYLTINNFRYALAARHYFGQDGATVRSCAFHRGTGLLVVGFSTGLFSIRDLPSFREIHTLSISQQLIDACAINASGEWLAFGSARLGQLLVWEWRSESYVAVVGFLCTWTYNSFFF
jgi:WD40 repeat protein